MADSLNSINKEKLFSAGLHVEILLKGESLLQGEEIINSVANWLLLRRNDLPREKPIDKFDDDILSHHVHSITLCNSTRNVTNGDYPVNVYHLYRYNSVSPDIEEEDEQRISTNWILPSEEFDGLWESLIYDSEIKNELLDYVSTALIFSEKNVNQNIITFNRIVLLHGPPGTGKTSLCKALAQKVCIRNSSRFRYGQLVEVNTHSLFSKWFSESGKLVTRMFNGILNMLEDPEVLVIVLLDEVETLARSRTSALQGNEPSDALRVVNAMLTHLDMIKRYPNALILTTSNITEAIDVALIDRADIKQYIGLPTVGAIYQIYYTCIKELQKAGIICASNLIHDSLSRLTHVLSITTKAHEPLEVGSGNSSLKLKFIAEKSFGLSGRSLRKMPFIACSLFIKNSLVSLDVFLEALERAVLKHWEDVKKVKVLP